MTQITDTTEIRSTAEPRPPDPPGPFAVAAGLLVALWCAGFAAITVWFELTDHFAVGQFADDATALSMADWFVAVLKVVGAAVALLAVSRTPRFLAPRIIGTLLWAAFATLAAYVVGSIAQVVFMLTGVAGDAEQLDAPAAGYVLAFLLGATRFGILATSYARRAGLGARVMLIGICGAPVVLGSVLVVLPATLRAVGLLTRLRDQRRNLSRRDCHQGRARHVGASGEVVEAPRFLPGRTCPRAVGLDGPLVSRAR